MPRAGKLLRQLQRDAATPRVQTPCKRCGEPTFFELCADCQRFDIHQNTTLLATLVKLGMMG